MIYCISELKFDVCLHSVVWLLHTSDRELQVVSRDVALVLVVKLFSILRHKLSGCPQTYLVDSLLSGVLLWTESTHMTLSISSLLSLMFHDFPASCGSLGSVHFSLVFPLSSGSDDFHYLPSGLLTVSASSPVDWEVIKFIIFFCFSSYTFSFGVSIWVFQISLHRDHHVPTPSCCCYSWTVL